MFNILFCFDKITQLTKQKKVSSTNHFYIKQADILSFCTKNYSLYNSIYIKAIKTNN